MTFSDIQKKYPMPRENMDLETHRAFLNDCFSAYEAEGFSDKFWSPFEEQKNHCGKTFTVVERCTEENFDLECLPAWRIRFAEGTCIDAYPEEIIQSEMESNGCPWFAKDATKPILS